MFLVSGYYGLEASNYISDLLYVLFYIRDLLVKRCQEDGLEVHDATFSVRN